LIAALNSLLYSNTWVALGAAALSWLTYVQFSLPIDWVVLTFVFASTYFSYNLQRLARKHTPAVKETVRHQWLEANKAIVIVTTYIALAISGVCFAQMFSWDLLIVLLPVGMISALYSFQFLKPSSEDLNKGLRDIALIKIFLIAGSWAIMTSMIPLLGWDDSFTKEQSVWLVIERGIFILAITIPFDMRDLKYDKKSQKTLPQILGWKYAKWLAIFMVLLAIGSAVYNPINSDPELLGYVIGYFLVALVISATTKKRGELFYSFGMDGTIFMLVAAGAIAHMYAG